MKKFFEFIGLMCLMCFSFFYTEKTLSVVKEMDEIMIKLNENVISHKTQPQDAKVVDNTIIPGIKGKEIDIDKSYKKMKKIGIYDESLLEYKIVNPKISIKNNYNKYVISGNKNKNNISLLFLINDNDSINKIYSILNKNNLKGNYFIDGYWFEDNNSLVNKLMKENNIVGNLGYNNLYQDSSYIWMNTILKSFNRKANIYCLKTQDESDLNKCALEKSFTISPTVIIDKDPYLNTLNNLNNGNIIAYEVNSALDKELNLIINKIKQKGYNVVSLDELIEE